MPPQGSRPCPPPTARAWRPGVPAAAEALDLGATESCHPVFSPEGSWQIVVTDKILLGT